MGSSGGLAQVNAETVFFHAGSGSGVVEDSTRGRGAVVEFGHSSADQVAWGVWQTPSGFTALTKATVIYFASEESADLQRGFESNYNAVGEVVGATSDSVTEDNVSLTEDEWSEYDVSGAFTAIAANDICQLKFTRHGNHVDDTITFLWVSHLRLEWR